MTLILGALLLLLNTRNSFQEKTEDFISSVIKTTTSCKNLKDCVIPKISALSLDQFPETLKEDVEIPVKIVVVLEQQAKKIGAQIGEALMNAIMIALEVCSKAQKAYTAAYNRVMTVKEKVLKMVKGVAEVMLSLDSKMSCVVVATLKKFSRENCQICQRMIPDFLDGHTAEKMSSALEKSMSKKAPAYIKDYLNMIKGYAARAAGYMDKLVVCVKSGKNVESCRVKDEESTLCARMSTLLSFGKQVISFMTTIGTTVATEIQGFIGRVTTTHKAYRQCLQSGAPISINITGEPVETSIIDKYEAKVKDQIKPLEEVATRALQTKLRMLRERKMQRARRLQGRRSQRRR